MVIGERHGRLALVLDLARQVTARRNLDDVLATTFRCLRPVLEFSGGSIQLLDDDGWIRLAATDPAAPPHVLAMRIPLGSTVGGRIILTEQPVYVPDVAADAAVPAERRKNTVSRGVRSYLGVPLVAEGRAIGLIQVDSAEPDAWDEEDRLLLSSVAPIVAAAIQNARAHALQDAAVAQLADVEARMAAARSALATLQDGLAPVTGGTPVLPRQGRGGGAAVVGPVGLTADQARRIADAAQALARIIAPAADVDDTDDEEEPAAAARPTLSSAG